MTNTKQQFTRFNQPVPCRVCGKFTTWSEANGYCGVSLCRPCFEEASLENEHFDGYHGAAPKTGCKHCQEQGQ